MDLPALQRGVGGLGAFGHAAGAGQALDQRRVGGQWNRQRFIDGATGTQLHETENIVQGSFVGHLDLRE